MLKFGLVDDVIPEPLGGAHWDYDEAAEYFKKLSNPGHSKALQQIPARTKNRGPDRKNSGAWVFGMKRIRMVLQKAPTTFINN